MEEVDAGLDAPAERRAKRAAAARVAEVTREVSARGWRKPQPSEAGSSPKKTMLGPGVTPLKEGGGIFKSAAVAVLRQERRLMSTGEICRIALARGLIRCQGKTPEATMASALYTDVKRKERMSVFQRPLEGLFGLREWEEEGFIPPGPDGRPITDFQPLRTNRYRKPAPRRGRPPRESPLGGEVSETPVKRRGPGRPPKSEDAHPSRRGPGRPRKRWRDEEDPSFVAGSAGRGGGMGTHDRPTRRPRRYEDDYEYGDDYEYEEEEYEDHSHEEDAEEDHDTRGRGGRGSAGLAKSPGGILDTPRVLDLPLPALGGDGEGGGQGEGLGGAVPPLFSSGGVSPALLRSPMRLFEGFGGKTPRGLQGAGSPMDIDGVLGMLYSPAAPGTGRGDGGRPTLSPLGRPSSGPKEEGLTVVGVGAKRAIEAYVKASPRPDLLRGGIPVPGNTANITAAHIPGAGKELIAMEEKASYLERTLGPNNPKTGIALLFLARGYLHTGSVLGADKALFALHKALETLQGYARLVHAPLSAQASKMFDYLKNHIMAAKASAARTQQAAEAAAQAAADAGIGPGIAGRRKSELEGPIAAGGANGLTGHAPGATAARAGGGGSEDGLGVPPQDGKGAGGARAGVGSGGREGS